MLKCNRLIWMTVVILFTVTGFEGPLRAAPSSAAPADGHIGYVLTSLNWAIYQGTQPEADCPDGTNVGPREQFATLFPANEKRNVIDTQLAREVRTWFPTVSPADPFPFHEPAGRTALGLNLDGKIGPTDFTSPTGEPGIDNQLFRVLGCIRGFRGPSGAEYVFEAKTVVDRPYNRLLLEISNLHSMANDSDVTVTLCRGMDRLLTDATGNTVVPGGSQRIDTRWGRTLVRQMKGRIVNGVLTTEPISDLPIPWEVLEVPSLQIIKDARLRLKLTASGAEGLIGGYVAVDRFYYQLMRNDSTHHLAQSDISAPSLYYALRRLADAYPDPKTGANTAISSALTAKFAQVYVNPLTEAQKSQLHSDTTASAH
jgi:hypothetical protein